MLILAMIIVMVVGTVLGYSGDLEKTIKDPLKSALSYYKDDATEETDLAYKAAWNKVQEEVSVESSVLSDICSTHGFLVEMLWN